MEQSRYELSSFQKGIWLLSKFHGGSAAYNVVTNLYWKGKFIKENLEQALHFITQKHEILRTVFIEEDGNVWQSVLEKSTGFFSFFDSRNSPDIKEYLKSEIRIITSHNFNLEKGPLIKINVYQISDEEFALIISIHHLICDNRSVILFLKEILDFYKTLCESEEIVLKPLSIQYKDYVQWQNQSLNKDGLNRCKAFWELKSLYTVEPLNLPADNLRPKVMGFDGASSKFYFDYALYLQIQEFSESNHMTTFSFFRSCLLLLLHKLSGQTSIIFGTPVSMRDRLELEEQIGLYINTLPLKFDINVEESFEDFSKQVHDDTLKTLSFKEYPLVDIIQDNAVNSDTGRNALFDVLMSYQDLTIGRTNEDFYNLYGIQLGLLDEFLFTSGDIAHQDIKSKFDLSFNFGRELDKFYLEIEYSTQLFQKDTILRFFKYFFHITKQVVLQNDILISDIQVIDAAEREQLLYGFNATDVSYPVDQTLVSLFRKQVLLDPDAIAVVYRERELSYGALDAASDRLAHYLVSSHGIGADVLVGLLVERSDWMIIAILGVLKSGGAYVPIDPAYPQERIDYMISDSNCRLIIDDSWISDFVQQSPGLGSDYIAAEIKPSDLAYVIYTSGSTGQPKGVMISHENVASFFINFQSGFSLNKGMVLAAITNYTFDISVLELVGTLINGLKIVLIAETDPLSILGYLDKHHINALQITPSRLNQLFESSAKALEILRSLDVLLVGGEPLSKVNYERLSALTSTRVLNVYGPTETTIWSSSFEIKNSTCFSIGGPLLNEKIYILDKYGNVSPLGVPGEICISGAGVGRGYLNRAELSAEKFVPNPYQLAEEKLQGLNERMYLTGDQGRWLEDGNIEFLGRKDDQVKIRGYRIEPGEIEGVLQGYPDIISSVVIARKGASADQELIAYLVSGSALVIQELRTYLGSKLPSYMVPSHYVQLESLPLNASGKTDRKALPDPEGLGMASGVTYVAPRTAVEEKLAAIWSELLEVPRERIGIDDDFLNLGGHSLKMIRLSSQIYKIFEVKTELQELFSKTTLCAQAALIAAGKKETFSCIPLVDLSSDYVLSSSQRRLWILSQFGDGNIAYNAPGVYLFEGSLDLGGLSHAFSALIERHEILRTVFRNNESGDIRQVVLSASESGFKISECDFTAAADQDDVVHEQVAKDIRAAFDLAQGPLLRAGVYRLSADRWVFTYVMHHIISDGWSMEILIKELLAYYNAYVSGSAPELPGLRIQYKDYAAWQHNELNGASLSRHRSYWQQQLSGTLPVLELATDRPRSAVKTYNGGQVQVALNGLAVSGLRSLMQSEGTTLFMGVLAGVNALLYRYSGQDDLIVGSPIAGRNHSDLEDQIGFYVNTLVLRSRIGEGESYRSLLEQTREVTLGAYEHQVYPFDELVSDLRLTADQSRNPLFDVLVELQHMEYSFEKKDDMTGLQVSGYNSDGMDVVSKFDLRFIFQSGQGEELHLNIEYNSDLYDRETVIRMGGHLNALLSEMIISPDAAFSGLDYLSIAEREQLLYGFNATDVSYPAGQTVVSMFREQVLLDPAAIAVVYRDRELSYAEVDAASDRLAHHLVSSHGIGADVLVGLLVERSDWMIIGLLGILKSGGAYVPIDPAYPKERIRYMVEDAGIGLLLTQTDYMFELDYYQGALFAVDVQLSGLDEVSGGLIPCRTSDLAYVIYTSGSTGQPKGVMIEHGSLMNYLNWCSGYYFDDGLSGHFGLYTSLSFDLTVTSIFCGLLSGRGLFVYDQDQELGSILSDSFSSSRGIDSIKLTPSHIEVLKHSGLVSGNISCAIVGGEEVSVAHVDVLKGINSDMRIYNEYGPTESTVGCIVRELQNDGSRILIGKPVSNTRIYITDRDGGLSAVGVAGEICISGAGLARGYLNRAELSAEKFVPNPYQLAEEKLQGINERMYLTGDQGRWLSDGNIEFLGRKDDQVKIRGYRIELGEIEGVLQGYPDMVSAVVIARKGVSGVRELIAYLVSGSVLVIQELRTYLGSRLPSYMVPSHYVQLDSLPLNANGKTDRKALPDPEGMGMASGVAYVAPRTEIEEKLAAIWSEVLNTPKARIGIHDSFFDLGGDSIKSIQIVSRLKQQGYSLTIQEVLLYPVIGTLSKYVRVTVRDIDQQPVVGLTGLSPIQRMFFEDYGSTPVHYNQSVLLRSSSRLSLKALRLALDKLVEHHDALRMVYYQQEGTWLQENKDLSQAYGFEEVEQELDEAGFALFCDHVQGSADLSSGPLFRAVLFRGSDGSDRLLLVSHHLVIDGVSWRIIFEDLSSLYEQFLAEQVVQLPLKTDSFRHWQSVQEEYSRSSVLLAEQAYWSLSEDWPLADLQADQAGGSNLYGEGTSESFSLDRSMTSLLLNRCYQSYHTEINDILVSGLVLSLAGVFGIDHIRIGMEGHGREDIGSGLDVTRTVGWFTTTYPVCIDLGYAADRIRQLIEVKECLHRVPNKGIGYGILRYLGGAGYQCRPSVTFNYLGDFGSGAGSSKEQGGVVSPSASLFSFSGDYHGREISGGLPRQSLLDVSGMIVDGCLQLSVVYSAEQYSTGRMRSLISRYQQELEGLILELSASTTVQLSPVDLSYQGLSVEQVHSLNADALLEDVYRLGPLQEGLYYHWLSAPDSSAYFMQISCRLHGRIDIDLLSESYRQLVGRHGVLRTSFVRDYGDVPLQVVRKSVGDGFRYHDVAGADDEAIQRYREEDRALGFDLESGSQMRLMVLCVGPEAYELIWSHHHIIMDGWCNSILIREIFQIYYSLIQGKVAELGEAVGYSKYINWLGRVDQGSSLGYWGDLLRGYDTLSSFSAGFSSAVEGQGREKKRIRLSAGNVSRLGALCSRLGVTENTFIQSVWGLLLGKYNDRSDVVFGAVVSGRPADLDGVEDMIGLFSNTVPVRIRVSPGMTFTDLLAAVQQESIAGSHYHYTQLAEVQQQSELGSGLFDHVLVFENYPVQQMVEQGVGDGEGLRFESASFTEQTNYGLTVTIMPGEEIELIVDYDPCYYEHSRMERMEGHLLQLIDQVLDFPEDDLSALSCLSAAEREQLLYGFNATEVSYPVDQTLVSLFREQVLLDPDAIAVVYRERELSYGALDAASDRLAHYLVSSHGIGADVLVGLLVERSDWMIIAILGVLKSGGAYVPIDPAYPQERIDYMISDSNCRLIIDDSWISDFVQQSPGLGSDYIAAEIKPSDLAYVIYTSGSTGQPKGVMISHENVASFFINFQSGFSLNKGMVLAAITNYTFDISVLELVGTLINGLKIVLIAETDPLSILGYLDKHHINALQITPSRLNQLFESSAKALEILRSLDVLLVGGEPLSKVNYERLSALTSTRVLNVYGPTETTIWSSSFEIKNSTCFSIGGPLLNEKIYILDKYGNVSPLGVPGEICISGAGVGRGYLNRAELSAEKFVPNPYPLAEEKLQGLNERMYLTGDQGRWLEDGNIEFLGRKDDQVKIRGYRIEPGEIEGVLQGYPDIISSVVIARKGASADQELIAYLVSGSALVIQELRTYLGSKLPSYMVPSHYVQLESLPLNASGKTDRKALPDPEGLGMASGVTYVAPRTAVEEKLAAIWSELLDVPRERIGIDDDFLNLGGHSLKMIRLSSQIYKIFEVKTEFQELLNKTTLCAQAELIGLAEKGVFTGIPVVEEQTDYPLSFSQKRLWVLSQFGDGNMAYNIPGVYLFEGTLDLSGLSHAFSALIERHEILRTVFRSTESGDIRQVVLSASESGFKISEYDFRNAVNQDDVVHEQVGKDIRAAFDLGQGPLLRAGVYRLGADRWVFTYVMHHIISDGWSMEILIKELLAYYNAYVSGSALELPGLRIQYKDYAAWQRGSLSGSLLSEHQSYWREQLSGRLPVLELATDRPRPAVKTYHGGEVQVVFAQSVLSGLRSLVKAAGATVFMGLLAGVNAFLYRYSGQDDLIVGSPIAGRNHSDLEDQIGFYVNTLALRHRIAEGDSYRSLLEQVREVTLGAYAHQVYPFDELVNDLRLPVDRSRNPLFDVLVALQSSSAAALEKDRNAPDHLKISSYELGTDSHVSKFELSFNFMADDDDLHLNIAYNSDLYDRETIIRMGGHLNALLSEIIVSPEAPLSTLCYLSTAEREQLLSGFNATEATYPADQTLVSLFREQVLLDADAIAVVYQDIALSYGELESSSNRLAAYLISTYGIVSEELIGIKLERSEWMIIAILGILKSGGAYVPIDPAYPQERIDYISKDSNCRVIIDAQLLADFMPLSAGWSEAAPEVEVSPSALAYVIYTSGSTGTPKGSLVTHHNVVRLFRTDQPLFDFGRSDVWTMFHSYCFDFSVWEMYGALLNGGKLVVVSSEVSKDPLSFLEVLRNHQVTVLNQTPSSFYNLMKEELDAVTNDLGLRYVIFGGESLSPSRLGLWLDRYPDTSLINMYGITETTVHVTYKKLTRSDILNNSHNIGRPIPTLSCYVLDSLQQLLPIGVPGELYVGGEGVCRGYLNREELTKSRFLDDLLKDGERVYRTGDKARMLANGEIEYLGRQDDQVKVRGYRIELGEIESALSGYPGLLSSVVLTRSGSSGDQELIAYVVSDATLSSQELRTYLSGKLPSYMIPGYYVQPSSLPLTSNGKIDRKALPNPEGLGVASGVAYVAPRNDTEEKLAEIWSEILDIPKARIGIYDSFFDLGGHSLKVIQTISGIKKEFKVNIDFKNVFSDPTIAGLSEGISNDEWLQASLNEESNNYDEIKI
ncbi:amino acid adenylation domain-containing protein [Pedobacter sp. FW305-3-2-15-E-R2A2]|uniref:non-ribosomal peptide synthetase n=1 Tax=Pedobacter sp. FW305-3-2-15-E-R2A2 TaxID=3140251 RepID=UPI00314006D4